MLVAVCGRAAVRPLLDRRVAGDGGCVVTGAERQCLCQMPSGSDRDTTTGESRRGAPVSRVVRAGGPRQSCLAQPADASEDRALATKPAG